jgi:hypothetical protein
LRPELALKVEKASKIIKNRKCRRKGNKISPKILFYKSEHNKCKTSMTLAIKILLIFQTNSNPNKMNIFLEVFQLLLPILMLMYRFLFMKLGHKIKLNTISQCQNMRK